MDNNFNQQAPQQMPQQPVYQQVPQQQMYQQAPQQQMYQQAPQQPMYQAAPKEPMKINLMELIAIICAGVSFILAVLGTTLTCTCSAKKTFSEDADGYTLSAVMILSIFAAIIAAGGIVCAIIALKQKDAAVKAGKLSYIAIAVCAFAVIYSIIPLMTMCGYNCSLENSKESFGKKLSSSW